MLRTWAVRLLAMELTLSVKSFPDARHSMNFGLAAKLAFAADLASDTRHPRR